MLYLDQPVQVGMSYDTLTNITKNIDTDQVKVANFSNGVPAQNSSFYVGTYPSQNYNLTTRGSENSARALWNFAQIWFQEFPQVYDSASVLSRSYTLTYVAQTQRRQNIHRYGVVRWSLRASFCSLLPRAE
jgi:hypothetical protein